MALCACSATHANAKPSQLRIHCSGRQTEALCHKVKHKFPDVFCIFFFYATNVYRTLKFVLSSSSITRGLSWGPVFKELTQKHIKTLAFLWILYCFSVIDLKLFLNEILHEVKKN